MVYMIIILLTVLGITDRFHLVLHTTLENVGLRHKLPPPALIQWLLIVMLFIFMGFQVQYSLHWVFLAAYAGLEVYGVFAGRILENRRVIFLQQEQLMTLCLFVLAFVVYILR